MPRKQRFKPSHKPKVVGTVGTVGTVPDLTLLDRSEVIAPVAPAINLARSGETNCPDLAADGRGRRDTDTFPSRLDLGGGID